MRKLIGAAALAAASVAFASSAAANTSTANMNVSITITSGCVVSVTNINFGSVPSTTLAAALTSTTPQGGLFTYTCSPGSAAPSLAAGHGLNYAASSNQMKGSTTSNLIPYALNLPSITAFTGVAQTAQITATIPAQTTLPTVDAYTDTVVLTLSY